MRCDKLSIIIQCFKATVASNLFLHLSDLSRDLCKTLFNKIKYSIRIPAAVVDILVYTHNSRWNLRQFFTLTVAVTSVTFLLIWEVLSSNSIQKNRYPEWRHLWFSSVTLVKFRRQCLMLCHNQIFPNYYNLLLVNPLIIWR